MPRIGWLLYSLPEPSPAAPVTPYYSNVAGDDVTWCLPPPTPSELTKPCPTAYFFEPPWQGCPTLTPG